MKLAKKPEHAPAGPMFSAYGADDLRWIENPESVGLRFVGLAHDVCKRDYAHAWGIDHTGWFTDDDGFGETVAGVVYQLPGKDGRARYLAGYADPFNADRDGRGPALLSVEVVHGIARDSDWETDPGAREAAQRGDHLAERMAADEREYQRDFQAGSQARRLAADAVEAARAWADDMRTVREFFAMRHAAPGTAPRRATLRTLVRHARKSCERLREAREDFHNALEWRPCDAWKDGYAEGV